MATSSFDKKFVLTEEGAGRLIEAERLRRLRETLNVQSLQQKRDVQLEKAYHIISREELKELLTQKKLAKDTTE